MTIKSVENCWHDHIARSSVARCARWTKILAATSLILLPQFAWPQAKPSPRQPSVATGRNGVVVSGKSAATAAGIKILEQGGNAADAGAATLLALSVTSVGAFCIGGEVPILVYSADQKNVKLLEGQG